MIDTYLCSESLAALSAFCVDYFNVIKPRKGRAATEEYTDETGVVIPAREGCGDPNKWYACIRHKSAVVPKGSVEVCSAKEGQSVVGVWA